MVLLHRPQEQCSAPSVAPQADPAIQTWRRRWSGAQVTAKPPPEKLQRGRSGRGRFWRRHQRRRRERQQRQLREGEQKVRSTQMCSSVEYRLSSWRSNEGVEPWKWQFSASIGPRKRNDIRNKYYRPRRKVSNAPKTYLNDDYDSEDESAPDDDDLDDENGEEQSLNRTTVTSRGRICKPNPRVIW